MGTPAWEGTYSTLLRWELQHGKALTVHFLDGNSYCSCGFFSNYNFLPRINFSSVPIIKAADKNKFHFGKKTKYTPRYVAL